MCTIVMKKLENVGVLYLENKKNLSSLEEVLKTVKRCFLKSILGDTTAFFLAALEK